MSIKNKIITGLLIGVALAGTTSCKKYLDTNTNPNVAHSATVDALLPTGEMYISSALGVDLEINGSIWAEYWTQNPNASQYRQLEQYIPTATVYEYPWTNLYNGGSNLYQMAELARQQGKKQYLAVSFILRAYLFQLVTDGWGDAPFTQAFRAQPKDGGIVNPKYDLQMDIYHGILGYLDSADALINPNDAVVPGSDDLIYSGDMTKWQKFSNTLRLRILLRMSEKDMATASAGIEALYAKGAAFIGEGDDAQINFTTSAGNKNPLFSEEVGLGGTQNLVGSKTCIDTMNADDDYRGFIFYEYVPALGVPVGIAQGDYNAIVAAGSFSIPTPYVAGDATDANIATYNFSSAQAPVKFLTSYESFFLQAEAVARGWGTGDDAALFMQGIHASFYQYAFAFQKMNLELADTTGLAEGDTSLSANGNPIYNDIFLTTDYAYYSYLYGDTLYGAPPAYWGQYPVGASVDQKKQFIITQKWLSMCGNQGFEAWCEYRRTGYPNFLVISKNSLIGNNFPKRFVYPNSEITTNLSFPGVQPVTAKVWWDIY